MRILVVGSGGREHALVWKIAQSPLVDIVYCAPGNAGIAQLAELVPIPTTDIRGLVDAAQNLGIDLTVVGPEAPLVDGIVDEFLLRELRIIGARKEAAKIEGSKVWAKKFMERNDIPTAEFRTFINSDNAMIYAGNNYPCCVKADGLAAGKGSIPCFTREEAWEAIDRIMVKKEFGEAGNSLVVEEFLKGEEVTFKVLTDGWTAIPLLATQDHKPVFDGDQGPNTGGMGAYAPAPVITKELEKRIMAEIIEPTLDGMREEGIPYRGCLYVGLMITPDGQPKVLEFNCRFGDPELQPLVLLMESDIVPILEGIAEGRLPEEGIKWSEGAAVCVVMASGGYPEGYQTGFEITGLDEVAGMKDVEVFHAGTTKENGIWKTAGGRVLGVTAKGKDIPSAISRVYQAVAKIGWDGEHHRTDIGQKALKHGFQIKMGL